MAIGPQLPPHLTKRKRDSAEPEIESDRDASPGPEKRTRTIGPSIPSLQEKDSHNPHEINLESSDDEEEGAGPAPPARSIGPAMPPIAATAADSGANPDEIGLDSSDDDDDTGPAPPSGPQLGPPAPLAASKPSAPRTIGPAMPPPAAQLDSDDSDDDDMGPAPLPASSSGVNISIFDRPSASSSKASSSQPAGPQRDAWMLAPPDGADWASKVDPTKLRNRRFASGPRSGGGAKSSGGGGGGGGGMGAEWTETPEEKRKRLADAVMGVSDTGIGSRTSVQPVDARAAEAAGRRRREDEETELRVREYNERNRGESLAKKHARTRNKDEDDDPSKRAFDREKDIAGGMKITHKQKREMMDRAANFGSRFAKGSYL